MNKSLMKTLPRCLALIVALVVVLNSTRLFAQVTFDEARKVHALLVLDTDSDLGEQSLAANEAMMTFLLESAIPKAKLEITKFTGKEVTANQVLAHYQSLNVNRDDVLLFYYFGHGSCSGCGQHRMNGKHDTVCREAVLRAMKAKGARLNVLLTDCCASIVPDARYRLSQDDKPVLSTGNEPTMEDARVLSQLLLRSKGTADITASQIGQLAWARRDKGGVFTTAFFNSLTQKRVEDIMQTRGGNAVVSWFAFYENGLLKAIDPAANEFGVTAPQKPHFFDLPDGAPVLPRVRPGISEKPPGTQPPGGPSTAPQGFRIRLGIEGTDWGDGVLVRRVTQGFPAHAAGFIGGEVIQSVDDVRVTRWVEVLDLIQRAEANGTLRFRGYDQFTRKQFDRSANLRD